MTKKQKKNTPQALIDMAMILKKEIERLKKELKKQKSKQLNSHNLSP